MTFPEPHSGPEPGPDVVVPLPIDGVLDLHTFPPKQVKDVVTDYLQACRDEGILEVRIIHGKGIGNLRRTVHALLAKHPDVLGMAEASAAYGGTGATLVRLRPAAPRTSPSPAGSRVPRDARG